MDGSELKKNNEQYSSIPQLQTEDDLKKNGVKRVSIMTDTSLNSKFKIEFENGDVIMEDFDVYMSRIKMEERRKKISNIFGKINKDIQEFVYCS